MSSDIKTTTKMNSDAFIRETYQSAYVPVPTQRTHAVSQKDAKSLVQGNRIVEDVAPPMIIAHNIVTNAALPGETGIMLAKRAQYDMLRKANAAKNEYGITAPLKTRSAPPVQDLDAATLEQMAKTHSKLGKITQRFAEGAGSAAAETTDIDQPDVQEVLMRKGEVDETVSYKNVAKQVERIRNPKLENDRLMSRMVAPLLHETPLIVKSNGGVARQVGNAGRSAQERGDLRHATTGAPVGAGAPPLPIDVSGFNPNPAPLPAPPPVAAPEAYDFGRRGDSVKDREMDPSNRAMFEERQRRQRSETVQARRAAASQRQSRVDEAAALAAAQGERAQSAQAAATRSAAASTSATQAAAAQAERDAFAAEQAAATPPAMQRFSTDDMSSDPIPLPSADAEAELRRQLDDVIMAQFTGAPTTIPPQQAAMLDEQAARQQEMLRAQAEAQRQHREAEAYRQQQESTQRRTRADGSIDFDVLMAHHGPSIPGADHYHAAPGVVPEHWRGGRYESSLPGESARGKRASDRVIRNATGYVQRNDYTGPVPLRMQPADGQKQATTFARSSDVPLRMRADRVPLRMRPY